LVHRGSLPRRLIYISTTGVYGDCGGDWLDETRSLRPTSARGARRVAAEAQLRRFGRRTGCRVSLLRAPGIYDSAERLPLARLHKGEPVLRAEDDVFTNHIHADDLARLLALALFRGGPGGPTTPVTTASSRWAIISTWSPTPAGCRARPACRGPSWRSRSPMTLSFMSESRRIGNARIKNELRARLLYPTVADALRRAAAVS
jgi:nucleoside-diphosphate-sugar epimerase